MGPNQINKILHSKGNLREKDNYEMGENICK